MRQGLAGLDDLAEQKLQRVRHVGADFPKRAPDVVFDGDPVRAGQQLVDADVPQVPVQHAQANWSRLIVLGLLPEHFVAWLSWMGPSRL